MKHRAWLPLAATLICAAGCAGNYVTPAGGVSLADISDGDIRKYYSREPASPFPAALAVVRVQSSGYITKTNRGYGGGRFSVVTERDIESDESRERIGNLPMVAGVAPVGRLLLSPNIDSIDDLRRAAAKLRADLLLVYSVDSAFSVDGRSLGPLSAISLGLIPNKKAHVTSTVAAVLVDVRTGFVYGTAEATAREEQRASMWSTEMAIDSARLRSEQRAFDDFVEDFGSFWKGVVETHAATDPPNI